MSVRYSFDALAWSHSNEAKQTSSLIDRWPIVSEKLWKLSTAFTRRKVWTTHKTSLLKYYWACCSVARYLLQLRSHDNKVKQNPLIDRWPLILFEKLWKQSTAFAAHFREVLRQRGLDHAHSNGHCLLLTNCRDIISLWRALKRAPDHWRFYLPPIACYERMTQLGDQF